jgi:hypothetical protein
MHMRTHLWLHGVIAVAVLGVLGLSAFGVAVPTAVVLLIVLACPAMMVFMMLGMGGHDHADRSSIVKKSAPASDRSR